MVVLFPGSINWCLVLRPEEVEGTKTNQVWANHSTNISFCYAASIYAPPDKSINLQWEVGLDGFTAWRPVQYAMHMQLLNTTDKNEGWYEAVRIDKNSLLNKWGLLRGEGSPLGNGNFIRGTPHFHMGGVLPSYHLSRYMYTTKQWQHEPTYITGELQDIHNAVFQLNCIKEENNFKKITNLTVGTNMYNTETVYQRDDLIPDTMVQNVIPRIHIGDDEHGFDPGVPAYPANFQENWAVQQLVSDAMDIIIVRIHGSYKTKVLIHSVQNVEFTCAENGQFSQYTTPSDVDVGGLEYFKWMRNTRFKYPFHYLAEGGYLQLPRPPYY